MRKLMVLLTMCVLLVGCASFKVNSVATNSAIMGISMALQNNPSHRDNVCKGLVALNEALKADCCWKDYIVTINSTFAYDAKYKPYAVFIISMLDDSAPLLDGIKMGDGDKANIKAALDKIVIGIGCQ